MRLVGSQSNFSLTRNKENYSKTSKFWSQIHWNLQNNWKLIFFICNSSPIFWKMHHPVVFIRTNTVYDTENLPKTLKELRCNISLVKMWHLHSSWYICHFIIIKYVFFDWLTDWDVHQPINNWQNYPNTEINILWFPPTVLKYAYYWVKAAFALFFVKTKCLSKN